MGAPQIASVMTKDRNPNMANRPVPSFSASYEQAEAPGIGGLAIHDGHNGCVCEQLHCSHEVHQPAGAGVEQLLCHVQPRSRAHGRRAASVPA